MPITWHFLTENKIKTSTKSQPIVDLNFGTEKEMHHLESQPTPKSVHSLSATQNQCKIGDYFFLAFQNTSRSSWHMQSELRFRKLSILIYHIPVAEEIFLLFFKPCLT